MPKKPSRWKDRSSAGGAVLRYSGDVTIRINYRQHVPGHGHWRNGGYYCEIALGGKRLGQILVGAPAYLSHAVDSPEAYDETASAAISFADDEEERGEHDWHGVGQRCDWGDSGRLIRRSPNGPAYEV